MACSALGKGTDRIPNMAFRIMALIFVFRDFFREATSSFSTRLSRFGIKQGDTVIDYGCGPGGFLRAASSLVGERGRVYAVDVHHLAIKAVERKIARHRLSNVVPVLADQYACDLDDDTADVIYALDMFHMVKTPDAFLRECHRLLKKDGHLIIDNGHQSRSEMKGKLAGPGLWEIVEESGDHVRCRPL